MLLNIWVALEDGRCCRIDQLGAPRRQRRYYQNVLLTQKAKLLNLVGGLDRRRREKCARTRGSHFQSTGASSTPARVWRRMSTETFFSDQKSRGFQLDRSHLSEPDRVQRVMLAACLAYLRVIYLGTVAQQDDWLPVIHRRHRCDLSLFQLGLRLLDYFLLHDRPILSSFAPEPESVR